MSNLIPKEEVHFENGEPTFPYEEVYACFDNNKLLFRLVDTKFNRWAFYNDTKDVLIKVNAEFGPGSAIRALQRTQLNPVPHPDGSVDENCSYKASLIVEPGFTEAFIEGTPNGFSMDFHSEGAPSKDVHFENGEPTVKYDKVYKCFKDNGNGLLFRLVSEVDHIWYFYNDTKEFIMHVSVDFALGSEVKPVTPALIDTAKVSNYEEGAVVALVVPPGKTLPFVVGSPEVYKLNFAAQPAGEEIQYYHEGPDPTVIPNCSKVYRCFKEHDNGLLFRIIDDKNQIWAFYNDTDNFIMTANVQFPPGTQVQLAPGVTTAPSTDGSIHVSVVIPPLATAPFLVGEPLHYELKFSAAPVSPPTTPLPKHHNASSVEVKEPVFQLTGPDPAIITYQEVYKCFKEHGNGLVFRLVDNVNHRWAFYNDTDDVVASIDVSFGSKNVTPLDKTVVSVGPEGILVFSLELLPRETRLFAEGELDSFTTKFAAQPIS